MLLALMVPLVSAGEVPTVPEPLSSQTDAAQQKADSTRADAEQQAQDAKKGAHGEGAKAMANDGVDFVVGTVGIVRDYAGDLAQRGWANVQHILHDGTDLLFPGARKAPESNVATHNSQYSIVTPAGTAVTLWAAAVSTGLALIGILVVRRLATFGFLPFLSRISHSEIYNNDARRTINELILAEAGLCLNEIVGRLGFSRNAVSYHLFVLEKEQAIVSVKDGKYRRYFTRNGKYVNGAKNVVAALRNETTLKLAQTVVLKPGAIQRDLCVELGATPSATCWHAKRLLDLGIIRKERVANTVQYFPGDTLLKYDLSDFKLNSGVITAPHPAPLPA